MQAVQALCPSAYVMMFCARAVQKLRNQEREKR